MGLKYNKNDGQLLSSALTHNLEIADQIVEDVQEGVDHLLSMIDDPFSHLSGESYNAAGTLFKAIVKPTLEKLKEATEDIKGELRTFDYERSNFETFPDSVYDEESLNRLLEIKRQQKATVEMQMNFFNDQLLSGLAKKAIEDFVYEGQRLQSVANHYDDEIREIEGKLRILHEFASATSHLFQNSLQTFQNAMNGAKALKTGSFDSQGNFSLSSSSDLSWYKKITGKDISRDLLHEPDKISASDIEEQEVANMNAETKAQLEQIALVTGLTLAQVIAMYAKASKTMAVKGGEVIHNVWDFISGEFEKLSPENRINATDKISTVVVSYDYGGATYSVAYVINETTNQLIKQISGNSYIPLISYFGGSSPLVDDGTLEDRILLIRRIQTALGISYSSAAEVYDTMKSTVSTTFSGEEYLRKLELEKLEAQREAERRAQENQTNSHWNGDNTLTP